MSWAATRRGPEHAVPTSMLCTGTKRHLAVPVYPLTEPRTLARTPMTSQARTRGLITVTDAPVSSMSCTDPLPLTLAVTMMGLPGVKVMRVALLASGELDVAAGAAAGSSGYARNWARER